MKIKNILKIAFTSMLFSSFAFAKTTSKIEASQAVIENDYVKVVFELDKGTYDIFDKKDNALNTKNALFKVNDYSSVDGFKFKAKAEDISDAFGEGQKLSLMGEKADSVGLGLNIYLYDSEGLLALENLIKADKELRVMNFSPMQGQVFASEKDFKDFRVLGGDAGEYDTHVIFEEDFKDTKALKKGNDQTIKVKIFDNRYETHSNILFTFGEKGKKQSLVYGGLSYDEFVKKVALKKGDGTFFVELNAQDPVGKLIDAGATYTFAGDKFYFNFSERNRFDALEAYGFALKKESNIILDTYTLTGLNFWYCMQKRYGNNYAANNSVKSLEVLRKTAKTGFLRYGKLGLRLEPDSYNMPNNQQGWWDDERFRMYGKQLVEPLDTVQKWGRAILAEGGVPLIYSQTGRRSLDYAQAFPEHMLFNESNAKKKYDTKFYSERVGGTEWTYDFTDEGFKAHMRDVYANFAKGGLIGVKFDFPDTAWAYEGGFEDKYATTTSAYRNVFKLAREGLGVNSDIHERIPRHGDVTLGIATTQRVERDTDRYFPTFARKCGLRWYKNRVVVKYVNDVINPEHSFPYNDDGSRAFYTMTYITNARTEIGKYIELMSQEHLHQLTRITPQYNNLERSAKPIDAFDKGVDFPQIYDLKINEDWHQVTFYNTNLEKDSKKAKTVFEALPKEKSYYNKNANKKELIQTAYPTSQANKFLALGLLPNKINLSLGCPDEDGGLGLDKNASYYVYDFWNDCFVGKFKGSDTLAQDLRAGEARMMSVHKVQEIPQFISTNRHILQGYVDMIVLPAWEESKKALTGTSAVIEKDPYKVIVALNGKSIDRVEAKGALAEIKVIDAENALAEMTLNADKNTDVEWSIFFK